MIDPPTEPGSTRLASSPDGLLLGAESRQIGAYRVLQRLGEGGMGEVWLAEQTEPIRRRVALKIIKRGMDTKQVVARFEIERQALALMDHPCVAKVFDAGTTTDGRPFFVMEYVKGIPITEYCDRDRLGTRDRLELLVATCEGVQHAHQKAVLHRDLKPSNVLVTEQDGRRLPKIIDFGLAKATAHKLTERTMFTELGLLLGTPEYMSPEQAQLTGEDVDTRTDVYSLGVILYELLTGTLPFDSNALRSGGFEGIRRMIREQEPKRPSTRFAALGDESTQSARSRGTDAIALQRQLRGDLDWIVMKALEKDRARRYGSPMDLAGDILRYLQDEPVRARSPSTLYVLRKFVRRHRLAVAATSLTGAALVAGFVGTTAGLVRARRAEASARTEQVRSERAAQFLSNTLSDVDPIGMGRTLRADLFDQVAGSDGRRRGLGSPELADALESVNMVDVARRLVDVEVLRKAVTRIESGLESEPALAADLYYTIGSAYSGLQLYGPARDCLIRATDLAQRTRGAEHESTIAARSALAGVCRRAGRYAEAETLYLEVVDAARRTHGEEARETLMAMSHLGDTYRYEGRDEEAESLLRTTLSIMRRRLGWEDLPTLLTANNLALALRNRSRYTEAEALLRETATTMERVLGPENRETLNARTNLAAVLILSGRAPEAEALLVGLLETARRVLGDEVYLTLMMRKNLGEAYVAEKRYAEAEALFRANGAAMKSALGEAHPERLGQLHCLARLLNATSRPAEAEDLLREVLEGYRRVLGERHPKTLSAAADLARTSESLGRPNEAALDRGREAR